MLEQSYSTVDGGFDNILQEDLYEDLSYKQLCTKTKKNLKAVKHLAEDISKRQISVLPLVLYRIPTQTTLLPNYPNPFNPETWIPFRLAKATTISLLIHDIHGNTIRHIDLNRLKAGIYESKDRAIYWDGRNKSGEYAASGVYFYTLRAGNVRATQKMILMK